jgi:hypothetical protein
LKIEIIGERLRSRLTPDPPDSQDARNQENAPQIA